MDSFLSCFHFVEFLKVSWKAQTEKMEARSSAKIPPVSWDFINTLTQQDSTVVLKPGIMEDSDVTMEPTTLGEIVKALAILHQAQDSPDCMTGLLSTGR